MAAPPPYWKKKTRPCPFYSQGRCLFSDACNFVHSVKVNHEPPALHVAAGLTGGAERDEKAKVEAEDTCFGASEKPMVAGWEMSGSPGSLRRSSSEGRRRTVLMSPPRSPRLSGLLSALESVIGPDVEVFEEVDEEDASEVGEEQLTASGELEKDARTAPPTLASSRDSTSLPYCQDSPAADDQRNVSPGTNKLSSPLSLPSSDANTETNSGGSAPMHPPSLRSRVPPPIITQHSDSTDSTTILLDSNTLEVQANHPHHPHQQHLHHFDDPLTPSRSTRHHSTFELLTSPFTSPALRILSPQIFPVGDPVSPIFGALQEAVASHEKPYADDDVDSLETAESLTEESLRASSSTSQASFLEDGSSDGSDDTPGSAGTSESSLQEYEDVGSPRETERPTSDYLRTPRNPPNLNEVTAAELENLLPLPPSLTRNSDGTDRRLSEVVFPSIESDSPSTHPPLVIAAEDTGESRSPMSNPTSLTGAPPPPLLAGGSEELDQPSASNNEPSSELDDLFRDLPLSSRQAEETYEEPGDEGGSDTARTAPIQHISPSMQLTPISTSRASLDSPESLSLGPSPVSTDRNSSHTSDTLVEHDIDESKSVHETILERRTKQASGSPKHLAAVVLTSPTKEMREFYFPASLEKTVRPAPSPLYEDSQHSASDSAMSSVASSPRPSWADLQKKAGASQKVPFGFRQSLLVDQEEFSSLAKKLASHFTHDSLTSRTSSASSLSPTSAFRARPGSRVDMLSGRARSASPAPFVAGPSSYRHSIGSQASSAPSHRIRASTSQPRSASQLEFSSNRSRSNSPTHVGGSEPSSSRPASWMKPLRLSQVNSPGTSGSRCSSSLSHSKRFSTASIHSPKPHVRNASQGSPVDNTLLLSSRSSLISAYLSDTNIPSHDNAALIANDGSNELSLESVLFSSQPINDPSEGEEMGHRHSHSTEAADHETVFNLNLLSPLSGSMRGLDFEEFSRFQWPDSDPDTTDGEVTLIEDILPIKAIAPDSYSHTLIPPSSSKTTPTPASIPTPSHAIATPRPTLMFAIASDNPAEVERVLASGEARPNDVIGPQSALEFALTNDALANKTEIVKRLLAYGADPSALSPDLRDAHNQQVGAGEEEDMLTDLLSDGADASFSKRKKRESALNPAMKYYLNRATAVPQAAQTSAALRRSDFRQLARMRFDFVGQDRALEHLYWVLGMHSQQPIGTPLVVLCCGPSGHGKSLLARKFGSLLDVPTHTVNMTILKTSHDLWQCPSMSPYDPPSERTLAEFLEANAGKRCVVVLDEIDKNEDERTLWSLLAPWELGRCSIDAGRRHIDVRNVIWLGTSNIGQDLVFEHHDARKEPDTVISKAEYRELMNALRPRVTERLGTSLMSRVTAVLPFVPFTDEERLAIASEAILALGGEMASELAPEEFDRLASRCVSEYVPTDGARSLYRSVSTHLMEAF